MPIGTAGDRLAGASTEDASEAVPTELREDIERRIRQFPVAPALPLAEAVPCGGCVELQLDVADINQRDEFAIALGDVRLTRVVWTVLVNFNSDQLAVQPFVDGVYGKYTSLHVNTFPLAAAVEVTQELEGNAPLGKTAQQVGLKVGSSGAWTGNQTMSLFVTALRLEGSAAVSKTFDSGPEGFRPRTHSRHPRVVFHPLQATAAAEPAAAVPAAVQPAAAADALPSAR